MHDAPENMLQLDTALEACDGADALVIMTPWDEFAAIDFFAVAGRMSGLTVIDPYRAINGEQCAEAGLQYITMGR